MISMRRVISFTTVFALAATATNAESTAGPCDLDCYFNTTCVPGSADFSEHPHPDGQPLDIHIKTISPNGWKCDCPEGKTGLRCGRTYIGCINSDHKCYNGGKCIPGAADRFGNTQEFCDCGDAVDKYGVKHVGKYCEIPVPVTCGNNDDDDFFCVNGGHCKQNYTDEPRRPCRCGPEYDGQHCEYKKGDVPNCTLECENGGQCRLGFKTYQQALAEYQDFWENNYNGTLMHCVCKDGFFGPRCEVASIKCDDKHCFNGGTCTKVTAADGTENEHCDCSKAGSGDVSYSGQFCQYEATSFCTSNFVEGGFATFCVNGGTCKNDDIGLECSCPEGFSGPICEFAGSETASCTLDCKNDGVCSKGPKDYSYLSEKGIDMSELSHIANETHTDDFEHCRCPEGWTGLRCETKIESCGDGSHVCLHGSTCVQTDNGYTCNCNAEITGNTLYAGKYCQHESTSLCTPDGMPGTGKNKLAFCVNNGKCAKLVGPNEEHVGCECDPGFSGVHCETRMAANDEIIRGPNSYTSRGPSNMSFFAIFFLVSGAILASVILVLFYRRLRNEKEEIDFDDIDFKDSLGPPNLYMGPEKDLDGNELENVEII